MTKKTTISDFIDLSKFKSIICLNGDIAFEHLKNINLPIISADGATNKLVEHGILPDIVIGDLDSVNKETLKNLKHIRIKDQDHSDYQKALKYVAENNISPSIVFGINGGYIDHIMNNISIFSNTDDVFVDHKTVMQSLGFGTHRLNIQKDTKISIFGMPSCHLTTSGLKWNVNDRTLNFAGFNAPLNRVQDSDITLHISTGRALVVIYIYPINDCGLIV